MLLAPDRFAKALAPARKRKKLTQAEVAKALGVSVRSYQGYERGENEPPSSKAERLVDLLGLSTSDIVATPEVPADSLPARAVADSSDRIEGLSAPAELVAGLQRTISLTLYTSVCAGDGTLIFDEASRISVEMPAGLAFHFFGFNPPPVMGVSEVVGDSMLPMFEPGDLVLYDLTPDAGGGGVFVINYDGKAACKRVQPVGRSYRLIPENRIYHAELIRLTADGYVHDETGEIIEFGIVGRILFPKPETPRLHVQQVGDLLRGMFREAAAGAYN